MQRLLKDFYYGNLTPSDLKITSDSELRQIVGRAADCEEQLMERLGETEQKILNELIEAQFAMDSITARENFIMGFRIGIRMMAECMDDNDGNFQRIIGND